MSRSDDPADWLRRTGFPQLAWAAWWPLLLLAMSLRLRQDPLPYPLVLLGVSLLAACFILIMTVAQPRRAKRDRSKPMLQQVQDDLREELEAEPYPAPFPAAARIVRALGAPWPSLLQTTVVVLHLVAFVVLGAALFLEGSATVDRLLSVSGLTRWDVALAACCVALLASVRRHAAAWRRQLDGERTPARAETAYG